MKGRHLHKHRKCDYAMPDERKKARRAYIAAITVLAAVFFLSAFSVFSYVLDTLRMRETAQLLREIYYADATATPQTQAAATAPGIVTPVPGATVPPDTMLYPVKYSGNENAIVTERFRRLRRQNSDIVGWLKAGEVIDQAVVQRDNTYYLRRDYLGYHNVNGAVFLDEDCRLFTRPYTITLYGHNMKTGEMFGALRNYENSVFYHNSPFITFDTLYENGRYVIFSVATISTDEKDWEYVNLSKLNAATVSWRQQAINQLKIQSIYTDVIDVRPEDQILLLMTCVEDEAERRIVAARRIREGESEAYLRTRVAQSRTR